MYSFERTQYGVKLVFSGMIDQAEMARWVEESRPLVASLPDRFCVFVDMRDLKPLDPAAEVHMQAGQRMYRDKGLMRSVVILNSPRLTMQFKRIALESDIYHWERYIDAGKTTNWEEIGLRWLIEAVDTVK
jgi:hypothetical protein